MPKTMPMATRVTGWQFCTKPMVASSTLSRYAREKFYFGIGNLCWIGIARLRSRGCAHGACSAAAAAFRLGHQTHGTRYPGGKGIHILVKIRIHVRRRQQPHFLRFIIDAAALGHAKLLQLPAKSATAQAVSSRIPHFQAVQLAHCRQVGGVGGTDDHPVLVTQ